ncbi:Hypothetical predicted protein [Podarcis lilfordi]|uniref:UPAR/Ly6 domain-containing protein n=2 Tax=Podarcis lilfordi TaxID=74358 RepID=A0AA35VWI9_9SAUR|nr:Hypothetical predicted protein [Podarcis lilfordi]
MAPKNQILLLAISAFLPLTSGDPLLCRDCTVTEEGCIGVEGSDRICIADPELESCNIVNAYEEGKLIWTKVGCGPKEACDTKQQVTKHIHVEYKCCEESKSSIGIDFCNDGL